MHSHTHFANSQLKICTLKCGLHFAFCNARLFASLQVTYEYKMFDRWHCRRRWLDDNISARCRKVASANAVKIYVLPSNCKTHCLTKWHTCFVLWLSSCNNSRLFVFFVFFVCFIVFLRVSIILVWVVRNPGPYIMHFCTFAWVTKAQKCM